MTEKAMKAGLPRHRIRKKGAHETAGGNHTADSDGGESTSRVVGGKNQGTGWLRTQGGSRGRENWRHSRHASKKYGVSDKGN